MRIFSNIQTSHVAGISRVMSSFAEFVRSSQSGEGIELVCVTIDPESKSLDLWREEPERGGSKTLTYQAPLPSFGDVVRDAKNIDDIRDAYKPLTDALRKKLKEEKPDVVLVNGTYFVPWCLVMAARSLRLPVVLYYHGSLTKETEHWKEKNSKHLLRQMEASFDRVDIKYLFPSELIKDFIEQKVFRHPLYRRHVVVLPNPIPEAFFRAKRRAAKQRVGFVGRWTRIKNPAFLVRFVELNRKAGEPFEIYVLTDPASRATAAKILHDQVRFVRPRAKSADLASFYTKMSAIICPSHFETYGNVAQEAVAAGTPAFVSRNMGVAEVLERVGLSELIVDFTKPRSVFKALQGAEDIDISRTARRALRRTAGAPVVHQKLLAYLRG